MDPKLKGDWKNGQALAKLLTPKKFDCGHHPVLALRYRSRGVERRHPARYAPATKLAQFFYNHRIAQRRSRSEKPEYEYNLDLVQAFLVDQGMKKPKAVEPPYLGFKPADAKNVKQKFLKKTQDPGHEETGVRACRPWRLSQQPVPAAIRGADQVPVLLQAAAFRADGRPGEEDHAHRLSSLLWKDPHAVYLSEEGLVDFAKHLQFAEVFISGSTGPLHLAAALGRPTAAFYPRRRSSTALRWQTVNPPKDAWLSSHLRTHPRATCRASTYGPPLPPSRSICSR